MLSLFICYPTRNKQDAWEIEDTAGFSKQRIVFLSSRDMDVYERTKADQINQPVHSRTILSKGYSYILYNGHDTDEIGRRTNRRRNHFHYELETRKRLNTGFKTKIKTTLLKYLASSFTILLATQLSFVSSLNIPSNELSNLTNKINATTPTPRPLESRNNTVLTKDPVYFINHINFTKIFDGPIASRETIVQRTKRNVSSMSTGTFKTPTSSNRINMLENEIRNAQSDITKLKTSSSINTEDRNRLATLEASLEMLQKLITNHKREQVQKTNSLESLVTLQTGAINNITNQLNNIKSQAEEQQSAQIRKELPEKCILAIKSHDFASAEKILKEINDYSKINLIVNAVYNHREGNFELVLRFGDSLLYINPRYYVYKALNYEMETNDHKNTHKMIKLARSVRDIINLKATPQNIKTEASSLESNLKTPIKLVTKEKLKTAVLSNNYQLNSEIKQLSNEVYFYSHELFEDIYREIVEEIYDRVDTNTLLSNIASHTSIGECILGFTAVFDKMRNSANPDIDSIACLAYYVNNFTKQKNLPNVRSSVQAELKRIRKGLLKTKAYKNAIFAATIGKLIG